MFARWFVRAGFVALMAAVGCSKGGDGSLATVTGVETQECSPIQVLYVNFFSTVQIEGNLTGSSSAQRDSSGKYDIATGASKAPGIPPGLYKVTVSKLERPDGIELPPDFDQGQLEASGHARSGLGKSYESLATTKLSATLEPGKNRDVNFDLKGK